MKKKINNAIVFDFDGVILNSHLVKTKAFYNTFKKFGKNKALKAKNVHLKNAGISRYIKFKIILKKVLKIQYSKKKIDQLQNSFSFYAKNRIKKLKVNKTLIKYFKKNYKKYNLYISTGTPEKEIINLTKEKKIYKYFIKVYGSPRKKTHHLKIIKKFNDKVIFIGDSKEDFLAAKKNKIGFIARINSESENFFKSKKINKLYNFKNLNHKIKRILSI